MRGWKGRGRWIRLSREYCDQFLSWLLLNDLANSPGRREHTHQLLVRPERLAERKIDVQAREVGEVGGEGREVVGVVPLPRGSTLEVVLEDPAETFNIGFDDAVAEEGERKGEAAAMRKGGRVERKEGESKRQRRNSLASENVEAKLRRAPRRERSGGSGKSRLTIS